MERGVFPHKCCHCLNAGPVSHFKRLQHSLSVFVALYIACFLFAQDSEPAKGDQGEATAAAEAPKDHCVIDPGLFFLNVIVGLACACMHRHGQLGDMCAF